MFLIQDLEHIVTRISVQADFRMYVQISDDMPICGDMRRITDRPADLRT
jgi:hypothetical protein